MGSNHRETAFPAKVILFREGRLASAGIVGFSLWANISITYENVSTAVGLIVSANEHGGKKKLDPQTTTPRRGMFAARQSGGFCRWR
jgi:hypothetical protein